MKGKKRETSKTMLMWACVYSFVLVFVVVLAWAIWDRADAAGLAGVVISPAITAIGFYTWKAKTENAVKLKKSGINITMEDINNADN